MSRSYKNHPNMFRYPGGYRRAQLDGCRKLNSYPDGWYREPAISDMTTVRVIERLQKKGYTKLEVVMYLVHKRRASRWVAESACEYFYLD